jgi:hypothetical protein
MTDASRPRVRSATASGTSPVEAEGVAKGTLLPIDGPQSYLCGPPEVAGGWPRSDERRFRYCPVQCAECGAVVQAAKFSMQHTSVQWNGAAVRRCAEFAERTAAGEQTPLIERCEAMRASIETAVCEGRVPVAPP